MARCCETFQSSSMKQLPATRSSDGEQRGIFDIAAVEVDKSNRAFRVSWSAQQVALWASLGSTEISDLNKAFCLVQNHQKRVIFLDYRQEKVTKMSFKSMIKWLCFLLKPSYVRLQCGCSWSLLYMNLNIFFLPCINDWEFSCQQVESKRVEIRNQGVLFSLPSP